MKKYFLVLRILLKNIFRAGGEKKSQYRLILYIFLGFLVVYLGGMFAVGMFFIAPLFSDPNILITYNFIVTFFLVIIFGLFPMLSYLYFSKDSEFFFSLPLKPWVIYFAKLTLVYMLELVVVLILLLPAVVSIGLSLGMGAGYYVIMLFAVIIVPAFPLMLTSLVAIPLMYVVSYLKSKAALSSIVAISLFCSAMVAYMFFITNLQLNISVENADIAELITSFEDAFNNIKYVFYPFLCLSRLAVGLGSALSGAGWQVLADFAVFFCSAAFLFLLAVAISNRIYKRGAVKNLESRATKTGKGTNVRRSIVATLMVQEWKDLYRNTTYAFQCLSLVFMAPLLTLILGITFTKTTGDLDYGYLWLMLIGMGSFMNLNVAAQTAVSRQGNAFYYSKIIPVDYRTQIKAKIYLYTIISGTGVILSVITAAAIIGVWWIAPLALVYLLSYSYALNCFAVWFDMKNPKLDWVTYVEVVKQNKNVIYMTFISMGISALFSGATVTIFVLMSFLFSVAGAVAIALVVVSVISIALAVWLHSVVYGAVDKCFIKLP